MSSLTLPVSSLERFQPHPLVELLRTEARNSPQKRVRITCEPENYSDQNLSLDK